jgi:hypothetical protein
MDLHRALELLGMDISNYKDTNAVITAWRQQIRKIHPDKNDFAYATKLTQELNEAKDILMMRNDFDKQKPDNKDYAHEHDIASEKKRQMEAEIVNARKQKIIKNRKKRAPGTRAHRKLSERPIESNLFSEMKDFFSSNLIYSSNKRTHLFVADIKDHFMKSRSHTTDLERRFYEQYANRLIKSLWPEANCSRYKNRRCYSNMCIKL